MVQSPPKQAAEAVPDDRESYRRFREIAFSMVPAHDSTAASDRSWLARLRETLSPNNSPRRRTKADYISLLVPLRQPQNLVYAPAALVGITALKNGDIDMAQMVFEEIRERVIKPSPLFYLMRGALIFVVILLLIIICVVALLVVAPSGHFSLGADAARLLTGFSAGCMGGFTSIMQRLDHFVSLVDRPRDYLTWTGFALPVVGGILGTFASIILLSNLLNVSVGEAADTRSASILLYALIGFIAGYSERFSKSLVKLAEEYLAVRNTPS